MFGGYDLRRSPASGPQRPGRRSPINDDEAQAQNNGLRMAAVSGRGLGPSGYETQQPSCANRYELEQFHSGAARRFETIGGAQVWSEAPAGGAGTDGGLE